MKDHVKNILCLLVALILLSEIICGFPSDVIPIEIKADPSELSSKYLEINGIPEKNYYYVFTVHQQIVFKVTLGDLQNADNTGHIKIYDKDNSLDYPSLETDLNKKTYSTFWMGGSSQDKTYYIEFYYNGAFDLTFTIWFYQNEIFFFKLEDEQTYQEYSELNDYNIYLVVPLDKYLSEDYITIKVTSDFDISSRILYTEDNQSQGKDYTNVRYELDSTSLKLDKIRLDSEVTLHYYKIKSNMSMLYLKFNVMTENLGIQRFRFSIITKKIFSGSTDNFLQINSRYSGSFLFVDTNNINLEDNIYVLMHTNISSILNVIGLKKEDSQNYMFGQNITFDAKIYENKKLSLINLSNEKQMYNYDTFIFIITNSKENYFLQFLLVSDQQYNIKKNDYQSRTESIFFIRETDSDIFIKGKKNLFLNEYQNNNGKFIYYNDLLYGGIEFTFVDIDNEIIKDQLNSDNKNNPHLIQGNVDLYFFNSESDVFGYNEYLLKCDNYYNKQVNKGDFIQICLEKGEKTEFYMPNDSSSKYKISLMISESTTNNYLIQFNDMSSVITLQSSNTDYSGVWNYAQSQKMSIENKSEYPALLFLKIETTDVQIINQSIRGVDIKTNSFYAFLLPSQSSQGEILGVYQELQNLYEQNKICIFHEYNNGGNYLAFPPKTSCYNFPKSNYDLNVTSNGVYTTKSKKKDGDFYTFIYINNNNNQVIFYYKHIILSKNTLNRETKFTASNDIIFYVIKTYNKNDMLFMEIIKNKKYKINPIYIMKKKDYIFTILNTFDSGSLQKYSYLYSKFPTNFDIALQFTETEDYFFFYEFGNSITNILTYDYIEDNIVTFEMMEGTKYKIIFKPFETNGLADYSIYIFNSSSEYSLDQLEDPYFVYTSDLSKYEKVLDYQGIESINGDFNENTKSKFIIDIPVRKNETFVIFVLANKVKPYTDKIYKPLVIKDNNKYIDIDLNDSFEKSYCIEETLLENQKMVLTLNKLKDESKKEGSLIIQWNNNSNNKKQDLIMYKGKSTEKIFAFSSTYNDFSYLLNTSEVNDNFDIIYTVNQEVNIINKICFQFIPSIGKSNYETSEIKYQLMSSKIIIPYFIDAKEIKTSLEIMEFKYNKLNIPELNISINYFDEQKNLIENKKYNQIDLKEPGDDNSYLGIYSDVEENMIYIEIKIDSAKSIDIGNELEVFSIMRKESIDFTNQESRQNITIDEIPQFYYIDLNIIYEKSETLIVFTDLIDNIGFNLFKNNYFSSESLQKLDKPLYSFSSKEIDNNTNTINQEDIKVNNILTIVVYSQNETKEGFIDLLQVSNITFTTVENFARKTINTKKIITDNDQGYFLTYYDKKEQKRYLFSYSVNGPKENIIKFFYYNQTFTQSSIKEIFTSVKTKEIIEKKTYIFSGDYILDIVSYEYIRRDEGTSNDISVSMLEYYEPEKDESKKIVENTDHGALISAIVFFSILTLLIITFGIRTFDKNKKKSRIRYTKSTSSNKSVNSPLISNRSSLSKSSLLI